MAGKILGQLGKNPEVEKEEYEKRQKEVENISNPIMRQVYVSGECGEDEDMG